MTDKDVYAINFTRCMKPGTGKMPYEYHVTYKIGMPYDKASSSHQHRFDSINKALEFMEELFLRPQQVTTDAVKLVELAEAYMLLHRFIRHPDGLFGAANEAQQQGNVGLIDNAFNYACAIPSFVRNKTEL